MEQSNLLQPISEMLGSVASRVVQTAWPASVEVVLYTADGIVHVASEAPV